ncbi:S9 family peptidase [Arachidicoccus terrestris]|nr:S9 family peptidase [Arachidicoccus terrestris]
MTRPYMDLSRVCIFGHSLGGYLRARRANNAGLL